MADKSGVRTEVKKVLLRAARDKFLDRIKPSTSIYKDAIDGLLESPNKTPQQREEFEQLRKGIELYEWNQSALQRGMHVMAKEKYKPEFVDEYVGEYNSLNRKQIEAEYSDLFDDAAERFNAVRPVDFNDFNDRLRERLDTNAGARGERLDATTRDNRLDRGRGDRLNKNTHGSNLNLPPAPERAMKTNEVPPHPTTIGTMRDIARTLVASQQKELILRR